MSGNTVECPICGKMFSSAIISEHANSCLISNETVLNDTTSSSSGVKRKSDDWGFFTKKKLALTVPPNAESSKKSKPDLGKSNYFKQIGDVTTMPSADNEIIDVDDDSDLSNQNSNCRNSISYHHELINKKTSSTNNLKTLDAPLAVKVRPQSFDDYIGQTKAVGKNSLLHSLLSKGNSIPSMVLWGPPGCGKTTLAKVIANKCQRGRGIKFVDMSATSASVRDVKELANIAQNDLKMLRRKTILFLDEIHRFNKLQQDALLPHVENGVITLIGATTENPSFHVNSALLSRCRVITLEKLQVDEVKTIVRRACRKMGVSIQKSAQPTSPSFLEEEEKEKVVDNGCEDVEQEFCLDSNLNGNPVSVSIEENAIDVLSGLVDGDARAALNGLQMTLQARLTEERKGEEKSVVLTVECVKEGLQKSHVLYDRNGEEHYNIASAMIKSMRGSNDSAALYWMTRMLEGGESPLFVARRCVAFASEDVGLADPTALNLAVSTMQACQLIGMPECGINLAHCVVYLSRAPKSVESFTGYHNAKQCIKNHQGPLPSVPLHLRNASTSLMKKMGYGDGYKYPPAFEGEVTQEYFPPSMAGTDFFDFMKGQRPRDESVVAAASHQTT